MIVSEIARAIATGEARPELTRLKAATATGTTSGWGAVLAQPAVAGAFAEALANAGLFDRLLADGFRRVPLRTPVAVVSGTSAGAIVAEGAAAPVTAFDLGERVLAPITVASTVAMTKELWTASTPSALALIDAELTASTALAADVALLATLSAGLSPIPGSTGSVAEAFTADLTALLSAIPSGQRSRVALAVTPDAAKRLATARDLAGARAFPGIGVNGGEEAGVAVVVTDAVGSGDAILVDAHQVAADAETVEIATATHATLQMDDTPDNPTTAATVLRSPWQENGIAVQARRRIGIEKLRNNAAAIVSGIAWDGVAS